MSSAPGQLDAPGARDQPEGAEVKSATTRRGGGGAKKRGDRRAAPADEVEARPEDFVSLKPYRRPAASKEGWLPVSLSRVDKAAQLQLSDDRLALTGAKGYRLARATHGAHEGTWYCEVTVTHLGETGERGGRGAHWGAGSRQRGLTAVNGPGVVRRGPHLAAEPRPPTN